MKLIYCIPATSNSGGMERVLAGKANYLVAQGHEVLIVTTDQRAAAPFFPLDERIRCIDLGINYDENNGGGLLSKLLAYPLKKRKHLRALRQLLLQEQADIVVSMFADDADLLPRIKDGSKKVLEYHFSKLKRLQYGRKGLWRMIDQLRTKLDEYTVRPYDRFVVLTEEDASYWGALTNIRIIPNALPFTSERTADTQQKRVIAVGRYDFQKNFEALLRIWSRLPEGLHDWQLHIYGNGPLRPALEAEVKALGLEERVHLELPQKEMPARYAAASIFVMTSRYEGLPMVLLEAQHMGLPIVSYACPCGPRDVISEGVDGYLVPMGDEALFLERLQELMQAPELRQSMGQAARQASARYEVAAVMQQWLDLFTSLSGKA